MCRTPIQKPGTMIRRSSLAFPLRLSKVGARLLCHIPVPRFWRASESRAREMVLVASPTLPHLRLLMVYRSLDNRAAEPDGPPRAA